VTANVSTVSDVYLFAFLVQLYCNTIYRKGALSLLCVVTVSWSNATRSPRCPSWWSWRRMERWSRIKGGNRSEIRAWPASGPGWRRPRSSKTSTASKWLGRGAWGRGHGLGLLYYRVRWFISMACFCFTFLEKWNVAWDPFFIHYNPAKLGMVTFLSQTLFYKHLCKIHSGPF